MVERGQQASLALESRHMLRVFGEPNGQDLKGDLSTQVEVLSTIHNSHATLAQLGSDLVIVEAVADH